MTAPNTNVEKQAKRHYGPFIGISLAVVFAVAMALLWAGGDDLTEDDAQDGAAEAAATLDVPAADTAVQGTTTTAADN